ncbi:hypothetical protein Mal65_16500 [Crateriforma conspicua]|nr:hypothetical protein Mal65_16500 [Crateriforma conspicua]
MICSCVCGCGEIVVDEATNPLRWDSSPRPLRKKREPVSPLGVSASVRQFWKPNDYFHHNINIINDRLVIRRRGGDGASWLKSKFKTIRKARLVIHLAGFFLWIVGS